jgi:TolB-like protein/class 3 adenylate cyclase/tetratricopeptide (TPR) repeat protein
MARDPSGLGDSAKDRRLAAVWFADIVGFTTLSSHDEDAALRLVQGFQAVTRRVVTELGGTLVKFLGDGGLAVFPSADAAVRAGLDIQRAFEALVSRAGIDAQLRVGVHLGEVVVEPDGDIYGDGVNTTHRIQHEAEPGQVVVSEDVWRQLRRRAGYEFHFLGERALAGLDEPMSVYAVIAAPEPVDRAAAVPTGRSRVARLRYVGLMGAAVLVSAALGWWLFARDDFAGPATAEAASTIAVLPFTDLSPGGGQEYLGDGMTEELINALTKLEGIGVVSRTSAFAYKGENLDVREIGRRLEVGSVLEGSIRVAGNRLRVTARLIDVENGIDRWSESFDREIEDVFAIQEEIARSIVLELEPELASVERVFVPTGTHDSEAYQIYLQGRYFWNKRTREGLTRGIELFEAAVRADTTYALPYTGLADAYQQLRSRGYMPTSMALPRQRAATRKALELDPDLSEAHLSLANLHWIDDWNWEAAEAEFDRAIELDPRNANARHGYSHYLTAMGRTDESLEQSLRALEISPYDIVLNSHLGWHYFFAREYEAAIEAGVRTEEMDPADALNHAIMAAAYEALGRNAEALRHADRAVAASRDAMGMGFAGFVYGRLEREADALDIAGDLERLGDQTYERIAVIHAGLRDRDEAFAWLERAYEARSPGMSEVMVDPRMDDLRSDPRFDSLVRRMGLR